MSLNLNAQNPTKKQPLISVLNSIEIHHNVSFSYADKTIKNQFIVPPPEGISITDSVLYLNENTRLQFEIINTNQIIIRKKTEKPISKSNTYILGEVLISNYLTNGLSLKSNGSVAINPNQFGILPGLIEPDILQTVKALPGINSVNETVSHLNVRGGTHDQNLFLWDGIKMYQSGHFFGMISAFNPYLTTSVQVIKNGSSAKYGDGVSSIIDMKLDETRNTEFSGGLGFNLIHLDGFAKIPVSETIEFQVSARRSITDLIETPTYTQYFKRVFQDTDITNAQTVTPNEAFYFYDTTIKMIYDVSKKDKLQFSFLTNYNQLDYLEELEITEDALESGISQSNLAVGLNYQRHWSNRFKSTLTLNASDYTLNALNLDVINDQYLKQQNKVLDTNLGIDTHFEVNNQITWDNGYTLNEVGISNLEDVNNPPFKSYIKEVMIRHAGYTEATFKNNNTHLKLGVRGSYFEKLNTFLLEPRLSFNQRFAKHFKVELLGEYKSQATSQIIDLQNDFLGIEKRRWVLANNTNRPLIRSKQASLGLQYNKNKLLLSAEGFYKRVNGITTRSQGFQNQFQFVDTIGNYTVKGIDILAQKQFTDFSTWLSYSFSDNAYRFDGLNENKKIPNNNHIQHAITWASTYTHNDIKVALGLNWHSGTPTTQPTTTNPVDGNTINYETPNSSQLKDYLHADFSANYTLDLGNKTKSKIGLSIWNVLNTKNTLSTYYNLSDDSETPNQIDIQSLGITPNVSFRVEF